RVELPGPGAGAWDLRGVSRRGNDRCGARPHGCGRREADCVPDAAFVGGGRTARYVLCERRRTAGDLAAVGSAGAWTGDEGRALFSRGESRRHGGAGEEVPGGVRGVATEKPTVRQGADCGYRKKPRRTMEAGMKTWKKVVIVVAVVVIGAGWY